MVEAVARRRCAPAQPLFVLGGGSNVVVADEGFPGLVVRMAIRGVEVAAATAIASSSTSAAGEDWDALVARARRRGLARRRVLSGIPGLVGATPIQNVGAYGQEVADDDRARARLRPRGGRLRRHGAGATARFGYRASVFKRSER